MDRDEDQGPDRFSWDDVRDMERELEGGYTAGPALAGETAARGRAQPRRPSVAPRRYQRPDDRIRDDVYDRLCGETGADASEVEVAVHDGEVTLGGTVPDREDKRRIERVAEGVLGVKEVFNRLRVTRPS